MSKLEDKLTASIKPSPRKVPAEKSVATAAPQAAPRRTRASAPVSAVAAPDLNDAGCPLHPDRIWPD